jgi:hypothetical protein
MTECKDQRWLFQDLGSYLSRDGGGLILRELERHNGLLRDLSGCFVDYRDQREFACARLDDSALFSGL